MHCLTPDDAVSIVCARTRQQPAVAISWIISRSAQGLLRAAARSEEWYRPTLDLPGEKEAFNDYLEMHDGHELSAFVQFALDMNDDGIPLTWEHHFQVAVEIHPKFWATRETDLNDALWTEGAFIGRHPALPEFKYDLLGIEFSQGDLERLLEPYEPKPLLVSDEREFIGRRDDGRRRQSDTDTETPSAPRPVGLPDLQKFVRQVHRERGGRLPRVASTLLHMAKDAFTPRPVTRKRLEEAVEREGLKQPQSRPKKDD